MLTYQRKPVSLSLISTDLPIWSMVETAATLYHKDRDQFHILLHEPAIRGREASSIEELPILPDVPKPRLLWLEVSPSRIIMTMQGNGKYCYRHVWERGVYGICRYWLQDDSLNLHYQLRMRNFTRNLFVEGRPIPDYLRLEYELWSQQLRMGHYVLELEIHH
ncbi:hypothetical protein AFK68_09990 [Hydrocoleum sp. CS-953]|uniref:hypothetical protein n=1 Tax=Hydrocoleum sp. CS-953 TaxID=1671698 RepID=UPI000B9B667D|nr:hypothetical protein [Hydrocoleum sp. CS-953]OZH54586.1 hypothetical protein AFK68_09990 [Hydrocoleum sp. CS-953]